VPVHKSKRIDRERKTSFSEEKEAKRLLLALRGANKSLSVLSSKRTTFLLRYFI
jgi:hypothetical protein